MAISARLRAASIKYLRVLREHARPMTRAAHERCSAAFSVFARESREDFERLSANSIRRWRVPENRAHLDDVVQEMLLGAHAAFERFDPAEVRDQALLDLKVAAYVVRGATVHSRRELHRMRGAKLCGNPGKNPSREELPFSAMGGKRQDGEERSVEGAVEMAMLLAGMLTECEQERGLLREERKCRVLPFCRDGVEETIARVVFDQGGLEEVVELVYGDPELREQFGLWGEDAVRELVTSSALGFAAHLDAAAE